MFGKPADGTFRELCRDLRRTKQTRKGRHNQLRKAESEDYIPLSSTYVLSLGTKPVDLATINSPQPPKISTKTEKRFITFEKLQLFLLEVS